MSSACRGRVMALPFAHLRRRPARVRATAPALALGVAARCAHQLGERADEDLVLGPVQLARLPLHLLPEPPLEAARGEHQLAQQRARAAKEGDEPRAQRAAQVRPDRAAPGKPAAALARHVVLREPLERTLLEDVEQVAPHLATEIPRGPPRSAEISKVDGRGGAAPAPSGCGGGGGRGPCPAPHRPTDVRWACDARVADESSSLPAPPRRTITTVAPGRAAESSSVAMPRLQEGSEKAPRMPRMGGQYHNAAPGADVEYDGSTPALLAVGGQPDPLQRAPHEADHRVRLRGRVARTCRRHGTDTARGRPPPSPLSAP